MKKKVFLLSIIGMALVLNSCNSDNIELEKVLSPDTAEIAGNPFALSREEAVLKAADFVSLSSTMVELRSALEEKQVLEVKVNSINVAIADPSQPESDRTEQAVPVYTVNYKDPSGLPAGCVVIAGDERLSDVDKIIAFSNDGESFDLSARNDADFLQDRIAGYLYYKINYPSEAFLENPASTVELRTGIDPGNLVSTNSLIEITTKWDEWCLSCPPSKYSPPFSGSITRMLCPGLAIIMGQIMAYHKWPQHGTFPRYTTPANTVNTTVSYILSQSDYDNMNTPGLSDNETVKEYIGNLVAETGYRLNAYYGTDYHSNALATDAPAVFQKMGFNSTSIYSYRSDSLLSNLNRNLPVFMCGSYSSEYSDVMTPYIITGHAQGYIYGTTTLTTFLLTKRGNDEGFWFQESIFADPASVVGMYTPGRDFENKWYCKMITSITKNDSNTGNSNPLDRVWNGNSY
ncbi:MAG: C10 family peptidase [Tannerella sp.]|jgi:hypothetical protein|nr:C10 family peptidase [Tannerella sp.]